MAKRDPNRRVFVQLAEDLNPDKHKVAGWMASEKLDGLRAFWDGGISRGLKTVDVPYAGIIDPKTGERKKKIKPIATGLWSRNANPIIVPDKFLDTLPPFPVDGELWAGYGKNQLAMSLARKDTPDPGFMKDMQFAVYSSPPITHVFRDGNIKEKDIVNTLVLEDILKWMAPHAEAQTSMKNGATFSEELFMLGAWDGWTEQVYLHRQTLLPMDEESAQELLYDMFRKVIDRGGEGLIVRNPNAQWLPLRVYDLLKYKEVNDAEAVITGFTSGRLTDKGSKYLGLIGAIVTDFEGKRLEISGLTNEEREFATIGMSEHAAEYPGENMPEYAQGRHFKVGDVITFKYRDKTNDGIPKEARYFRKKVTE